MSERKKQGKKLYEEFKLKTSQQAHQYKSDYKYNKMDE